MRGDHALHERKLARALGEECRAAHPEEVPRQLGAPVGLGGTARAPGCPSIADEALREGTLRGGRQPRGRPRARAWRRGATSSAASPTCTRWRPARRARSAATPLAVERVIEIGNIFKLGTKYSEALGAKYLDESGKEQPVVMGSYGIGPARIAAAAIEQHADADGIVWPAAIAPFQVHIVVGEPARRRPGGRGRGDLRRAAGRPASTRSWTTATSGPA